ncbi:hypothetical protein ACLOJK_018402 [Asimina triloba]
MSDDENEKGLPSFEEENEESILQFLDSMDTYLTLFDSLSSHLRQCVCSRGKIAFGESFSPQSHRYIVITAVTLDLCEIVGHSDGGTNFRYTIDCHRRVVVVVFI